MLFLIILRLLSIQGTSSDLRSDSCRSECTTFEAPSRLTDIESIKKIIDDYENGVTNFVDESIARVETEDRYIKCSLEIIRKYLGGIDEEREKQMRFILVNIFNTLACNSKFLALFSSFAFHKTNFLTNFDTSSGEEYRPRGLLMIHGEENYEALSHYKVGEDFVSYPDKLAIQNQYIISATTSYFKCMMKGEYNFDNMMKAFAPEEYVIYKDSGYITMSDDWKKIEKLYKMMMAIY